MSALWTVERHLQQEKEQERKKKAQRQEKKRALEETVRALVEKVTKMTCDREQNIIEVATPAESQQNSPPQTLTIASTSQQDR
jgi:hypothetical protein